MSEFPEMIPVDSSNVESIGYNEESEDLYVNFLSGGRYVYRNVPKNVHQEFMDAPSKGTFLHQQIKDVYPYEKL